MLYLHLIHVIAKDMRDLVGHAILRQEVRLTQGLEARHMQGLAVRVTPDRVEGDMQALEAQNTLVPVVMRMLALVGLRIQDLEALVMLDLVALVTQDRVEVLMRALEAGEVAQAYVNN